MNNRIQISSTDQANILEKIRIHRNDLIKKFLVEEYLQKYLLESHSLRIVSKIKLEFIKRALGELLIAPIDLERYGKLIMEMRKSAFQTIPEKLDGLFFKDIELAIKNYVY